MQQARQTFGETLPAHYLTAEEFKVYQRLYGAPLRETRPEDVGISERNQGQPGLVELEADKHALLRENEEGDLEEVEYVLSVQLPAAAPLVAAADASSAAAPASEALAPLNHAQIAFLNITANNEREYEALLKLQHDFAVSSAKAKARAAQQQAEAAAEPAAEPVQDPPASEEDDEAPSDSDPVFQTRVVGESRLHKQTLLGQFGTKPSTISLPKEDLVVPIQELLGRTDPLHVREAAEREFGGPALPDSPATPESRKNRPMKAIPLDSSQHKMSVINADAFLATVIPAVYASVSSVLVEVRKRLGSGWIENLVKRADGQGPRVLDLGAGGAGLAAWQEVYAAEWEALKESGKNLGEERPPGKKTVVVGSDRLRHRISRFLHDTTFLPRLPDYVHSSLESTERHIDANPEGLPPPRKTFDLIMAAHALMPLDKQHKRDALVENLWAMLSPEGGVLIFLEKGHPRGFEAVADVRDRLVREFIMPPGPRPAPDEMTPPETEQTPSPRSREPGMLVAPCTNHAKCPMYLTPGLSSGRKDFCHFSQRFTRPPFLQRVLGASHRNHEDVKFSFVAVQRGLAIPGQDLSQVVQGAEAVDRAFAGYEEDATAAEAGPAVNGLSLPRNILPPIKRRGHVTLDLCTPAGALERWTVPRSFSKQAYHDARKARWGDLWALGAKTRVRREPRMGRAHAADMAAMDAEAAESVRDDGGVRSRRLHEGGRRQKHKAVELVMDAKTGVLGTKEPIPGSRGLPAPRRTKGGRKLNVEDLIEQSGLDGLEDEADDEEDGRWRLRRGRRTIRAAGRAVRHPVDGDDEFEQDDDEIRDVAVEELDQLVKEMEEMKRGGLAAGGDDLGLAGQGKDKKQKRTRR